MNIDFRNRIAAYYLIATSIIIAVVFCTVFFIVKKTVYQNLDQDLSFEANKHTAEVEIHGDSISFINKAEWEEREHKEIQVNPVFLQIMNHRGVLMDKSPNLKEQKLYFNTANKIGVHFDTLLHNKAIRQVQIPILEREVIKGYILAAMSLESSKMVIVRLKNVLLASYPMILVGLFFISRYLAGRSIAPIKSITETTNRITKNNLDERVVLPKNRDELYTLSSSINELMNRIQNAIQRERQFTSDASHELRTPLASIRGTLEVLIRKPRSKEDYETKITDTLLEIDKITTTVEQLLHMARLDTSLSNTDLDTLSITALLEDVLLRFEKQIEAKQIKIEFSDNLHTESLIPQQYSYLILENVIGNAIKYSDEDSTLFITIGQNEQGSVCIVEDEGIGIKEEDIEQIFNPFFRSDALGHKQISGNGLGLSITQRAANAIGASVSIESKLDKGTKVTINFKQILRKPSY
ncbi:ATP-binding protein [Reichenbachiella sp. MALMAid0571]|uniref:sensor histidine kinase n=1 Tax=Reichenbachiella sp. MALMAid0571 TaxID=3143939 RepID=UPI0032DF3F43